MSCADTGLSIKHVVCIWAQVFACGLLSRPAGMAAKVDRRSERERAVKLFNALAPVGALGNKACTRHVESKVTAGEASWQRQAWAKKLGG